MQFREYPRTNVYEPTDVMLIDKVNGGTKQLTLGDLVSGDNNPALKAVSDAEQTLSTKRHEIGEYLIWENTLYKVTAPIAIGNTLTPGGNIEATTVGNEMASLKNDLAKKTVWTRIGIINQLSGEQQVIDLPQSYSELLIHLRYYNGVISSLTIPNGTSPRNIMGKVETLNTVVCYCGINNGRLIIKINEGSSIGMSCEVLAKLA